jgi:molybdopterin synthase catalytic subunit
MMQVRVLPFGVLKDWLGSAAAIVELPQGATVAELLAALSTLHSSGQPVQAFRGIAVSVNSEYASAAHVLREDDEVGLLPPVSGGATANSSDLPYETCGQTTLTRAAIDAQGLIAAAKHEEDGAVVVFDGIVRNNTRGRRTLYLDYEAYEEMAAKQMDELAGEARTRFGVRHVTLVHRLGRLQVGETSVLIVVASAHRGQAFDACRWLIDTLKKTVPIWKKETFEDGTVWAAGEPFPAQLAIAPEGSDEA